MTATQFDTVNAVFAALCAGDLTPIEPLLSPDVDMILPYQPEGFAAGGCGKGEVMRFLRAVPKTFAPFTVEVTRHLPLADGRGVVVMYTTDAKVRASGRPYRNTYIGLFEFDGELLRRWTEFHDPRVLLDAFDLMAPTATSA